MPTDVTKWRPDYLRTALDLLLIFLTKGLNDRRITEEMGLELAEVSQLKGILLHEVGDLDIKDDPHRVYLGYKLRQEGLLSELEDLGKRLRHSGQANAELGAIRARSDLIDKILNAGQSLGVIPKEAKKHQLLGGIMVADMTPEDMEKMLLERERRMSRLQRNYGSGKYIESGGGSSGE